MGGFELRPYQQQAVEAVESEWEAGHRRTLLVQATGTGKTICFAKVAKNAVDDGGRVLIMAHRDELLSQASSKIERACGLECAVEKAEQSSVGTDARIVVGSVQTLWREKRLSRFSPDCFSHIIIDEAHHAVANTYKHVLEHFPEAQVLGVTATADRADKKSLSSVFDSIAYEYSLRQAIDDGYLCPIEAEVIPLKLDISKVKVTAGDYSAGDLDDALEPYLDLIADRMADICRNRHTVVFLPLVETAKAFRDRLIARGLTACEVDGTSQDRKEVLADFEAGRYQVCCNSMLLTEGWDCPSVDCVVVLRPTKSRGLYCQMIGRGTRLSPSTGKKSMLLLDFLWLTGKHDLCRPASLFAETDEQAKRMTRKIEKAKGPVDLEAAQKEAIQDIQALRDVEMVETFQRHSNDREFICDPLEYGVIIGDRAIQDYEETFAWEFSKPTVRQKQVLEMNGFETDGMTRGMASMLIGSTFQRREKGLATPKQVRQLYRLGFRNPGSWSKKQAGVVMDMLASNHWKLPKGLDPAAYVPC